MRAFLTAGEGVPCSDFQLLMGFLRPFLGFALSLNRFVVILQGQPLACDKHSVCAVKRHFWRDASAFCWKTEVHPVCVCVSLLLSNLQMVFSERCKVQHGTAVTVLPTVHYHGIG